MKKILKLVLAATALIVGTLPASAQLIKFGTLAPEGSPWYAVARELAAEWKKTSGGKVDLRIYPGGVVGDDPDMVRKMRIGQLQMAGLTGEGLRQIVPDINVLQVPVLLTNDGELEYVRSKLSPEFEAALEAKGFKLLAWADAGWVHFFTSRPVIRPNDLKGEKLWSWADGDTSYLEAWKAAGFTPVPLPATEIYTGLQSRLITAVQSTPLATLSLQWYAKANHMTDLNLAPFVGAMVITTKAWNEIPEAMRAALLEQAKKAGEKVQSMGSKLNEEAVEAMTKRGLTVHKVPAEAVGEWEAMARQYAYPKLIGTAVPAATMAKAQALRDEYRKAHPRP
jgi:TRAP-type C4-dicarboxylate transport system substrate-binding protein